MKLFTLKPNAYISQCQFFLTVVYLNRAMKNCSYYPRRPSLSPFEDVYTPVCNRSENLGMKEPGGLAPL